MNQPADLGTANGHGSRVIYSESFSTGAGDTKDKYGHGTHVAGVVAGNAALSDNPWNTYAFTRHRAKLEHH